MPLTPLAMSEDNNYPLLAWGSINNDINFSLKVNFDHDSGKSSFLTLTLFSQDLIVSVIFRFLVESTQCGYMYVPIRLPLIMHACECGEMVPRLQKSELWPLSTPKPTFPSLHSIEVEWPHISPPPSATEKSAKCPPLGNSVAQ